VISIRDLHSSLASFRCRAAKISFSKRKKRQKEGGGRKEEGGEA
jgi:hypothetical protein